MYICIYIYVNSIGYMYEICIWTPRVSDCIAEPESLPSLSVFTLGHFNCIFIYRYLIQRHYVTRVAWPAKYLFERASPAGYALPWSFGRHAWSAVSLHIGHLQKHGQGQEGRRGPWRFLCRVSNQKVSRTDRHQRYDWRNSRWRQMSI